MAFSCLYKTFGDQFPDQKFLFLSSEHATLWNVGVRRIKNDADAIAEQHPHPQRLSYSQARIRSIYRLWMKSVEHFKDTWGANGVPNDIRYAYNDVRRAAGLSPELWIDVRGPNDILFVTFN